MGYLSIKSWSSDDKPRERLISKGPSSLTNTELLAILLSSGYKSTSALEVAREILQFFNDDLESLAKAQVEELIKIKGIGIAKAVKIISAIELSRRRNFIDNSSSTPLNNSEVAFSLIFPDLIDKEIEEFWVLYLNSQLKLIKKKRISVGGLSGTYVDRRVIFKEALLISSPNIILAHNHPSGVLSPSEADIDLTLKIQKSAFLLDISLVDHLIIFDNNYFSFSDEGLLTI